MTWSSQGSTEGDPHVQAHGPQPAQVPATLQDMGLALEQLQGLLSSLRQQLGAPDLRAGGGLDSLDSRVRHASSSEGDGRGKPFSSEGKASEVKSYHSFLSEPGNSLPEAAGAQLQQQISRGSRLVKAGSVTSNSSRPANWTQNIQRRAFVQTALDMSPALLEMDDIDDFVPVPTNTLNSLSSITSVHLSVPTGGTKWTPMLNPNGPVRVVHDIISLCLLGFDVVCLPVVIAWEIEGSMLAVISRVSTAFWAWDVLLTFMTGIYVRGELVMDFRVVASNYLRKFFLLDVAVVLVDVLVMLLSSAQAGSSVLRLFKVSRLFRLTRTYRMVNLAERTQWLQDVLSSEFVHSLVSIFWPFVLITVINHWLACAWYAVGAQGPTDTTSSWLETSSAGGHTYASCGFVFQYLSCYHWALTQMTPGSVSIGPQNSVERVTNILSLLIGMVVFSSIISTLSARLSQHRERVARRGRDLAALHRFLKFYGVERNIGISVERLATATQARRSTKMPVVGDIALLSLLPSSVRSRLRAAAFRKHLTPGFFRIWSEVDRESLDKICNTAIENKAFVADDTIFSTADGCEAAQILVKGTWYYKQGDDYGSSLDAGSFVSELALWITWQHMGTATSLTSSVSLALRAEKLGSVVMCDSTWGRFLLEYGVACYGWALSAASSLSDVLTVGCKFIEDLPQQRTSLLSLLPSRLSLPSRVLVSRAAVRVARPQGALGTFKEVLSSLRDEVPEGNALFVLDGDSQLIRLAAWQLVAIVRRVDEFFVHVGSWSDGAVSVDVRFPGVQVRGQEVPEAALQRALRGPLLPLAQQLGWTRVEVHSEVEPSRRLRIPTEHIQTVNYACLSGEVPGPKLSLQTPGRRRSATARFAIDTGSRQRLDVREVHLLADEDGSIGMYAWIDYYDYTYAKSSQGEVELRDLLSALQVTDADVQKAVQLHRDARFTPDVCGEGDEAGHLTV